MAIEGSCLCGGVRFEIDAVAGPFELCHCNRCRKASGAGALPTIVVRSADYRLLVGRELVRSYEAPILYEPPPYRSSFCGRCGSPVPDPAPGDDRVEVPAGLLDDDPGIRPDKHIFVELLPPWDTIADQLPRYGLRDLYRLRSGRDLPAGFVMRTHAQRGDRRA